MQNQIDSNACQEYNQISRRTVVGGMTFAAAAATLGLSWMPRISFAQSANSGRDVIINIFLRGGADGMSMVAPHGEAKYYTYRPNLAIKQPGQGTGSLTDLDGFFGLHPSMNPLMQAWNNGHLAVVHAIGSANWTRSHFDAQRWMEFSVPDHNTGGGWLARHLSSSDPMTAGSMVRGLSFTPGLPRTLVGAPNTMPIANTNSIGFPANFGSETPKVVPWMRKQYDAAGDSTRMIFRQVQGTYAVLEKVGFSTYVGSGSVGYTTSTLGHALQSAACVIKANIGVEAVFTDVGGWDTHASQGVLNGSFNASVADLAANVAGLYDDLMSSSINSFTIVVMSEFGRDVIENASLGTDHGTGNCMFVISPSAAGGKVYGKWPGLDSLLDGHDLQPTTDYRDVLAEVVKNRLKNQNLGTVFPGYTPQMIGFLSAA